MDAIRTINITFGNAKHQADRLNECAVQLQNIESQIDSLSGSLQREWSGDAASAYIAKCGALKEKIAATASDLNRISGVIRTAANAYYSAEMRALEIAKSRE